MEKSVELCPSCRGTGHQPQIGKRAGLDIRCTWRDGQRIFLWASFALSKRYVVGLVGSAFGAVGWFIWTIVEYLTR